jgi:long-chain acyl-CoA synthetase
MSPKVWTVEVTHPAETPKGESPVRRHVDARYGLSETPHPAIRTIYDLVQFNALRWGDTKCFGTRKVVKIHKEKQVLTKLVNGVKKDQEKTWMFWELGPFEYRSYRQVAKEGLDVGAGLVKLGLEKGDKVAVYADTSYVSFVRTELIAARLGRSWRKVQSTSAESNC